MKKIISILIIIAIIVGAGFYVIKGKNNTTQASNGSMVYVEAKVKKGDIKKSILGNSVIEANKRQNISPSKAGNIESMLVEVGDEVKKGDVLALMQKDEESDNYQIAKKNLDIQKQELNDLKNEIEKTNIYAQEDGVLNLGNNIQIGKNISKNLIVGEITQPKTIEVKGLFGLAAKDKICEGDDAELLFTDSLATINGKVTNVSNESSNLKSGNFGYEVTVELKDYDAVGEFIEPIIYISKGDSKYQSIETISVEQKKGNEIFCEASGEIEAIYKKDKEQVKKGDLLIKLSESEIRSSIDKKQINIDKEELQVKEKASKIDDIAVKAPFDGQIISISKSNGDYVEGKDVMMVIADMNELKVNLKVDELDIFNITKGQKAVLTTAVFEGKEYFGEVDVIGVEGKSKNGVSTFDVSVVLDKKNANDFKLGMNVDAEIFVANKQDVLIVPVSAIKKMRDKYYVQVSDMSGADNKSAVKEVEIGVSNDMFAEVVSGLNEGDSVFYVKKIEDKDSNNMRNMMNMRGMGSMGNMGRKRRR